MKISIIIPTHNRAETLRNAIESIIPLQSEAVFEFVIVDNNSNDNTKEIVESYPRLAKYVFEGRTSFTAARKTGADNANGEILLYLDDDVLIQPGSLRNIVDIFSRYPDCGVIAGRIEPKYTQKPPEWTLACQKSFNGWSLFNSETYSFLRQPFQEVPSAAGPMMAIRRSTFDLVGGFPPDTVGVETNKGLKSFNKLYIGPGDYGLCLRVREAGYRVYFSENIAVFHVIPPVRFTVDFWRSRMIGEAYQEAISHRGFFNLSPFKRYLTRLKYEYHLYQLEQAILLRLQKNSPSASIVELSTDELWLHFYKSYLDMDFVLRLYPKLWKFLWKIGNKGVSDEEYADVVDKLPVEYRNLVSSEFIYDATLINSLPAYERIIKNRGYYSRGKTIFFSSKIFSKLTAKIFQIIKSLRLCIRS